MLKILKRSIFLMIITLGFLFLLGTSVNATENEPVVSLIDLFEGKNATINENTITLTGDVFFGNEPEYEMLEITGGDCILDLNGYSLTAGDIYFYGGTITIKDETGEGKINANCIGFEEKVNATIENGIFPRIFNAATLTIENGEFNGITVYGKTIINGGKFTGGMIYEQGSADVTITGGEWNQPEDLDGAIVIYGPKEIFESSINEIIGVGYEAVYDEFELDPWYNTPTDIIYQGYYKGTVKVVKASENFSDLFKKITDDEVWELNALRPKNWEEAAFLLEEIANKAIEGVNGYYVAVDVKNDDTGFDPEIATIELNGEKSEIHRVRVKYLEASEEKVKTVNAVLDKIKYWEDKNDITTQNSYILDDLYLINYLFSNAGARVSSSQALNFAKDLINATNGANISYVFEAGAGGGGPLYTEAMGRVIVYYAGEAYTARNVGLVANRVIYIPQDTANTDEAYIAAALKRIKDYIGQDANITITVGGTLESLNDGNVTFNDHGLIDVTTSGSNYYNVKINGNTYTFAICKKDANKLETPKYVGSNIENNITITSDNTTIPLDTAITAKKVENDTIKKALGTSIYAAYDISLYSSARETSITKLENGKFLVSIPVPENLKDKNITVYYITSTGEREAHATTVKDGMATFETDHFSTYVLAETIEENDKDETPKTGSVSIISYILIICIISIVICRVFRKKI